jgi:iron complex outermembrane receptor protein
VPTDPLSWVISRQQTARETYRRNHGFDGQTTYEHAFDATTKNLTQLGYNGRIYRTVRERSAAAQPIQSPINIYTGVAVTPLLDAHPALIDNFLTDDFYWNLYGQNQTTWNQRWVLTLGAGYGEQEFGRKYPANLTPPANLAQVTATRRGELTPNAGLVYRATREVALFASYSTSYSPAPGDSQNASGVIGEFRPVTGQSYEAGVKRDAADGRMTVTLSLFETRLDHALVQSDPTQLNPNGVRYFTQVGGTRRTRGVEFSGSVRPLPSWRIDATASYLDARYFGEGRVVGSRMERTPPWAFSARTRYDFTNGVAKGWGASLGVVWQDTRWSTQRTTAAPDPLLLPSYASVDAALFYRIGAKWDVAINCENLFDKIYFITGATGSALETGAPRTVSFRITYRGL